MSEPKSFWIAFAEGRISVEEMLVQIEEMPVLMDWIADLAFAKLKRNSMIFKGFENGRPVYEDHEYPLDARALLQEHLTAKGCSTLARHLNIHSSFSHILADLFPEETIHIDTTLSDKFGFMLDACPQYIGGPQAEPLLEQLLSQLPEGLSKTKRIKLYKEKVKELFHVSGKTFPYWIQDAEWPISPTGKPMRFLMQKRKKKKGYEKDLFTQFYFEDVDTGEVAIVEQFT